MKIIYSIILPFLIGHQVLAQWEIVDESDCAYNAVFFLNDSVGFVAGICGGNNITIKKTTNYGESWYIVHDTINAWIYDIYFPSDSIGYASTYENVLKTTDGGETWFYPTPAFEGYPYRSIVFQDNEIGFGCFGNGGIAFSKTTDGGFTWIEQFDFGGLSLIKTDSCSIKLLGNGIYQSLNCTESWQLEPFTFTDVSPLAFDCSAIDTSTIVCGIGLNDITWDNFGFIVNKNSSEATWQMQIFNNIYKLNKVHYVDNVTAYCVGQPYYPNPYSFLKTVDGGDTWNYQEYEFVCETCYSPEIRDIFCPSENVCYAISGGGSIWRTLNGGGELYPLPTNISKFETNNISISPNPATGSLNISSVTEMTEIQIFNSLGQLVHKEKVSGKSKNISISELGQGIYIIAIKSDFSVSNQRFVKQ